MNSLGLERLRFKKVLNIVAYLSVVLFVVACVSSGPATTFYSLFPNANVETINFDHGDITIGIGPVILPEYLENPAVVSLTKTRQVRVAGYHAWAGDLKDAVTRVIADNISSTLDLDGVVRFPWDTRVRPDYQIRIVFDEFAGPRGGDVRLSATWTLLDKGGKQILLLSKEELRVSTGSNDVNAYVTALNQMLNQLSSDMAEKIKGEITPSIN